MYRAQHRFPALPFHRMLLLARTLLSAAMMILFALQSGGAKLGASRYDGLRRGSGVGQEARCVAERVTGREGRWEGSGSDCWQGQRAATHPLTPSLSHTKRAPCVCSEHARHLQRTASEVKRCCQCLAAVLRSNAPVGPAIAQLARLEDAFLELQRAVGGGGGGAAAAEAAARQAGSAEAALACLFRSDSATADAAAVDGSELSGGDPGGGGGTPAHAMAGRGAAASLAAGASSGDLLAATLAQGSLALHLSISMLFTCCTRVRAGRGRGGVAGMRDLPSGRASWQEARCSSGPCSLPASPPLLLGSRTDPALPTILLSLPPPTWRRCGPCTCCCLAWWAPTRQVSVTPWRPTLPPRARGRRCCARG